MYKNTSSKRTQVPSVVSSSDTNETKNRKLENNNQQLPSIPSTCKNTGSQGFVKLCKDSFMPSTDLVKLGKIYF